ncbi:carboxymuconolactone decarboxylase family protein [Echinicola strongylocentroti]|uniref:Carboxymuconolactone decarboxylase family protein n=1 Tax=Echinicola strongylocentroti TaxID=1795355 RepID=A0A2Z4IR26_9BACT|nr:carboxymuconolactone decarboxylase family protein [Echinicola strongylocentroti]AWW32753.1 carboxymuconolactone decarboxylase family protein [Echinicola strongylocentroti]
MSTTEKKAGLTIHTLDSAPEESKSLLKKSNDAYGYVPNLHGVLAGSPQLLEAYQTLHQLFTETSFDQTELTVVWQTINVAHECHYCVPAHTGIAHAMNVDEEIIEALRNGTKLPDEKLQVLHETTLAMVEDRGVLSDEQLTAFYDAGYDEKNLMEIILGLSQKVISNYTNHIAETPLDKSFEKFRWEKK